MKFRNKENNRSVGISTASLPDIVFMLLFFFMVSTVMKEETPQVETKIPEATQMEKLEKKKWVVDMYIGKPMDRKLGEEPKIYMNGRFVEVGDIPLLIETIRNDLSTSDRAKMTIALKIDGKAKIGLINDVKLKLREANARKINYKTIKKENV